MPRTWLARRGAGPCSPFFFDRRRSGMAVITLKTLVLRGVAVTGDVVTARTRIAGYQANGGLAARPSFLPRPAPRRPATQPGPSHDCDDNPEPGGGSGQAGAARS